MPETYTEVTRVGFGKRIQEALKGVIVGIILFFASFAVLWINEGRIDLSKVAKKAMVVNPNQIETAYEGQLISVSDTLTSPETIGDPSYLKPGNYIKLERIVEMYAWIEEERTRTETRPGGEEVRVTTYTYKKEWTRNPPDSSTFRHPEGHENPPMAIKEENFFVQVAKVGTYQIADVPGIRLPEPRHIAPTQDNVILDSNARLEGEYIFIGKGSLAKPQIGDLRISFRAVPSGIHATLFGKLEGGKVVPYYFKGKHRLYAALEGTREEAIAQLAWEHKVTTWILRIIGFLMMWLGLCLFFEPLNTLLDIFPFFGKVSRGLISLVMFVVALVLSSITIVVSMIVHNIVALIVVLLLICGGLWFWKKRRKFKTEQPVPSQPQS